MAKAAKMYNDNEGEIQGAGITNMVSRFLEKTVNPYLSNALKNQYAEKAKAKAEPPKVPLNKVVPVRSKLHPTAKRVPSGNVGIAYQVSPPEGPSPTAGPTMVDERPTAKRPTKPAPSVAKAGVEAVKELEVAKPPPVVADTIDELMANIESVEELNSMPKLEISEMEQPEPKGETVSKPSGNLLATKALPTFICRVGTKADIAKWIVKHMTADALETYVEPFIGGGAIYLEKAPAQKEAINDFNYGIYKSWVDLKDTRPAAMLEEWRKDKTTRAYAKTVLGHGKEYGVETLNIKAYIERNIKLKGANAEKTAFGKLEPSEWTSKLNGNKLRYIPKKEGQPSEKNAATLEYTDLKDNSTKKYSVAEAKLLYSLLRAGRNLLDNTRSNKLDIAEYTGSAKPKKEATKDIVKELMEEDLPKVGLKDWLKDNFKVEKNPDKYAIKEEENVLVGKTKIAQLIYEKLRSCGGFGGSGVVDSIQFIKFMDGTAPSPLVKVPMLEAIKFLLYPDGGLAKYNERLKNTDVMNGDYYKLVEKYDSSSTFFMLDPPYQATGGYGNPDAFNFEAFVKALNGIPDKILKAKNPKLKGKILVTINGGDKVLALFRKYARASGIPWYGLKVYVRQKAGKGGYRYEIFYGNYKFDERAVNVLDETFRNNFSGVNVKEEDESQFKEPTDDGAIYIDSDGSDKGWEAFKKATGAVGHFAARNAEDPGVGIAEKKYKEEGAEPAAVAEPAPKKTRKPRAKKTEGSGMVGGMNSNSSSPSSSPRARRSAIVSPGPLRIQTKDTYAQRPAEAVEIDTRPASQISAADIQGQRPSFLMRLRKRLLGFGETGDMEIAEAVGSGYLSDNGAIRKGMIGGYYSPNRPTHLGSKLAYTPSVGYGGSEYNSIDW